MPSSLFKNTELAFQHKSIGQLKKARFLFWLMGQNIVSKLLSSTTSRLLQWHIPISWFVKKTIYEQFCGGENQHEYRIVLEHMQKSNLYAILDYSVEGKEEDSDFLNTQHVILELLEEAKQNVAIPCVCLKITGIARFALLEKMSSNLPLEDAEKKEWTVLVQRLEEICNKCLLINKPLYIDAEESWIQPAIDQLCEYLIKKYNRQRVVIYTTIQFYRHDRFKYLEQLLHDAEQNNYFLGIKLVRGAYLEKENERALSLKQVSPIHVSKQNTDADYNQGLALCFKHLNRTEICLGTHNEESCLHMIELMKTAGIPNKHPNIWFSQLYGMSDHISYNLSVLGYNVSKYLPFGPVHQTMPYLIRRANENSSISGQMSKEYQIYDQEIKRRQNK